MSAQSTKRVVIAALFGNLAIFICKVFAAYLSGSTATLAEAVHSLADCGNQGLLLVGLRLSMRPATERFPFGRASELYFWPFIVALMLFSVGGAFAIVEGVRHLFGHAEVSGAGPLRFGAVSVTPLQINYAVLICSLGFEALSFRVAWQEFSVLRAGRPIRKVLREARDPTVILVVAEDATALVGLLVALAAVAAHAATGRAEWDAFGSLLIGGLLCVVASFLAWTTHGLLIGEGASPEDQAKLLEIVTSTPGVLRVTQLLTLHLGPNVVLVAMKIAFREEMSVKDVEEVTNHIESNVRTAMPHMKKIFIEADALGDGRGVTRPPSSGGSHQMRHLKEASDR